MNKEEFKTKCVNDFRKQIDITVNGEYTEYTHATDERKEYYEIIRSIA